ncbi:(d)CMP kinase [Leyella stercorea]|uniref:(d)CMP kinase n=1 Tax=Leyella stercorea TaxID=363265 RepID=UPI001A38A43B|nr:(d)CMP kinase [Leyella stercorea]MBL6516796.1 (d)CMP kinase [Leyella stercorea]
MKKIIVAIDGFSSCGKSTMAKDLAREVGYIYVDTGAMYRAVTLFAMRNDVFDAEGNIDETRLKALLPDVKLTFQLNNETKLPEVCLNGENVERYIRTLEVSQHVSPIAALPFVREKLVEQQQAMGNEKGIVMDGRDIGTVVFPNAELKIFVTASAEIRAQRRFKELETKGMPADFNEILQNVEQRDYIDTHRETSPLRQADDALVLDNSHLTIAEQKVWLMEKFNERTQE